MFENMEIPFESLTATCTCFVRTGNCLSVADSSSEVLGVRQSVKRWWEGFKADKPEQRYISKSERRAFPKKLGYPPRPPLRKHGPWAPGETKPARGKYYCH